MIEEVVTEENLLLLIVWKLELNRNFNQSPCDLNLYRHPATSHSNKRYRDEDDGHHGPSTTTVMITSRQQCPCILHQDEATIS